MLSVFVKTGIFGSTFLCNFIDIDNVSLFSRVGLVTSNEMLVIVFFFCFSVKQYFSSKGLTKAYSSVFGSLALLSLNLLTDDNEQQSLERSKSF